MVAFLLFVCLFCFCLLGVDCHLYPLLGSAGYPDFTNPVMRDWWANMFSFDNYEVGKTSCGLLSFFFLHYWVLNSEPSP
jgi:hypothetical protein